MKVYGLNIFIALSKSGGALPIRNGGRPAYPEMFSMLHLSVFPETKPLWPDEFGNCQAKQNHTGLLTAGFSKPGIHYYESKSPKAHGGTQIAVLPNFFAVGPLLLRATLWTWHLLEEC